MSWGPEEVGILPNQLRAASARKESLPSVLVEVWLPNRYHMGQKH